jgi:hypothetical protein
LRILVLAAIALGIGAAALLAYRWAYPPTAFRPEALAAYYRTLEPLPRAQVDHEQVRAGIMAATDYLRRVTEPNGRFIYLRNMNPRVHVPVDYNTVRHAGTVYALGMAQDVAPDPRNVDAMRRAVGFLRDCCFERFTEPPMIAVGELAGMPSTAKSPRYSLGGAALGLVAVAALERAAPGAVPRREMHGLARFGRFMQREDGQLYSRFEPGGEGRVALGEILFYPGEMALGWLMLHELELDPDLVASATNALMFLADKRRRQGTAPPDHWALIATARLLRTAERDHVELRREALIQHALQICHAILEDTGRPHSMPVMQGSLVGNGLITPTATRLEALLSALTFLPPDHPIVPHVQATVDRGVSFLLRAQVKEGEYAGAMPRAITVLPDSGEEATAFNRQATEVRIDYVQHALSALVQFLQLQSSSMDTRS